MILTKYKRQVYIAMLFVILIILLVIGTSYEPHNPKERKISLVVYGSDVDRWENLRQGAELAAREDNVEISLVTTSSDSDYNEQISIIEREIANGADALMIAACDSAKMGEYADQRLFNIPVVFVETGVESNRPWNYIAADDYQMGYALGQKICSEENYIVKVAIVSDGTQRNSISERERGLRDAIEGNVNKVVSWKRNWNEINMQPRVFLQRELVSEAVDVIVTLDNSMTDALMDALENLNKTSKVYSISTSNRAVYCLDQKMIKYLTYQSEFGIGYIGAKFALDSKNARREYYSEDIQYKVVSKDDMYDYDNQMLLFPFVK